MELALQLQLQQAGSCPLEMKLELEAGATGATAIGAGDPTFQAVQERCRVTLARYKDPSTFSSSARCRFNIELDSCWSLGQRMGCRWRWPAPVRLTYLTQARSRQFILVSDCRICGRLDPSCGMSRVKTPTTSK